MGLTGLNSRCTKGYIPFQRFQKRIPCLTFLSFQRLPTFLCSCPTSIFKTSNGWSSLPHEALSLILLLLLPYSSLKDPCDYTGPIQIIQHIFLKAIWLSTLITSANLILPCHMTAYLQVLEIRTWTTLGDHYSPYHTVDLFQSLHLTDEAKETQISKNTYPVNGIKVLKVTLFFMSSLKFNNQILSIWYI